VGANWGRAMELVSCYDCDGSVSSNAVACPHCGSSQPWGPYRWNATEKRKFRIEDRNDNYLVRTTLIIGFMGLLYGVIVGQKVESNWYGIQSAATVLYAAFYGFVGVAVAVPLAATINMYRSARHFLIPVLLVVLFVSYEFGWLRLQ
jgi:hypothetical protein